MADERLWPTMAEKSQARGPGTGTGPAPRLRPAQARPSSKTGRGRLCLLTAATFHQNQSPRPPARTCRGTPPRRSRVGSPAAPPGPARTATAGSRPSAPGALQARPRRLRRGQQRKPSVRRAGLTSDDDTSDVSPDVMCRHDVSSQETLSHVLHGRRPGRRPGD